MNIYKEFNNKRILILGFAREGISTYKYFRNIFPHKHLVVADKKEFRLWDNTTRDIVKSDKFIEVISGNNYLSKLEDADIVIKSPGIPYKLKEIRTAKKKGVDFTSQTKIFMDIIKGIVVGVTGTKGKSTTASLIHHILKLSGKNSVLVGNIGKPPLSYISKDSEDAIFIFEMSSHQLCDIDKSPHVAVFLNFYKEHMDYYKNISEYFNAKSRIGIFQKKNDYFIGNRRFPRIITLSKKLRSNILYYGGLSGKKSCGFLQGNNIVIRFEGKTFKTHIESIVLRGNHNTENVIASTLACLCLGLNYKDIVKGLTSFKPLEGRLEDVGRVKDVIFINDTLATIPESTIEALRAFKNKSICLILGGYERKQNYSILTSVVGNFSNLKGIVLLGETGKRLLKIIESNYKGKVIKGFGKNMDWIVDRAYKILKGSGVVLLSPAAASFDMFDNYKDRGDKYKAAVKKLKKVCHE